jgi:hypothetical protein
MSFTVLVCGGRDFEDITLMTKVLHSKFDPDDTVTLIHGNARGADRMAEKVLTAYFRGGFEVRRFPANWNKYGKSAGYLRNKQMLEEGKPDLVIAFPGGKGTASMIKLAKQASIPVESL